MKKIRTYDNVSTSQVIPATTAAPDMLCLTNRLFEIPQPLDPWNKYFRQSPCVCPIPWRSKPLTSAFT